MGTAAAAIRLLHVQLLLLRLDLVSIQGPLQALLKLFFPYFRHLHPKYCQGEQEDISCHLQWPLQADQSTYGIQWGRC